MAGNDRGRNSDRLDLRFLPVEASISIDELVQTSGHGGIIPPAYLWEDFFYSE